MLISRQVASLYPPRPGELPTRTIGVFPRHDLRTWGTPAAPVDVLTSEDIFVGSVLAFALAFVASFLQGSRSRNDFVLWEQPATEMDDPDRSNSTKTRTFDAEAWNEISRPDNYVFYNRGATKPARRKEGKGLGVKKTWVLVALLALFVPIFSVEFFFALSRQVLCDAGDPLSRPDWAEYLCSPVVEISSPPNDSWR